MSVYDVLRVAEGLTCRPQKIYIFEAKIRLLFGSRDIFRCYL